MKNNKFHWTLPFALFLLLSGCKYDRDIAEFEIFDYGIYYCFCGGSCSTLYALQDQELTKFRYQRCDFNEEIERVILTEEMKNLAQALANEVPAALYTADPTIGMPDAGDWGGYRIRIKSGSIDKIWYIDTMTDNLPEWIRPFQQKIKQTIEAM